MPDRIRPIQHLCRIWVMLILASGCLWVAKGLPWYASPILAAVTLAADYYSRGTRS